MRSLFQDEENQRISSTAGLSIALHALLLALIIAGSIHVRRVVVFKPMAQGSSQQIAVVAVSRGALAAVLASEHPALTEQTKTAKINMPHHPNPAPAKPKTVIQAPRASHEPSQPSAQTNSSNITGQGSDAQSMYPAYPTLSPSPQVRDRTLLPQMTQRIIVDVDLDSSGRIAQTTLVKGMGNALDQLVLDTVSAWQFHPAMVNGQPTPSRIELVFPFDRNYPEIE